MVPKPKQEWDELDKKKVQLNSKVVYITTRKKVIVDIYYLNLR